MPTQTFKASTKYGDFKGTASADEADSSYLRDWIKNKGLSQQGEFLVGIECVIGENPPGKHEDPIYVSFLFVDMHDFESARDLINNSEGPIPVRKVSLSIPIGEFLGLFKRFEVSISPQGMLDGHEYQFFAE